MLLKFTSYFFLLLLVGLLENLKSHMRLALSLCGTGLLRMGSEPVRPEATPGRSRAGAVAGARGVDFSPPDKAVTSSPSHFPERRRFSRALHINPYVILTPEGEWKQNGAGEQSHTWAHPGTWVRGREPDSATRRNIVWAADEHAGVSPSAAG